jgi:hypothetical protein
MIISYSYCSLFLHNKADDAGNVIGPRSPNDKPLIMLTFTEGTHEAVSLDDMFGLERHNLTFPNSLVERDMTLFSESLFGIRVGCDK